MLIEYDVCLPDHVCSNAQVETISNGAMDITGKNIFIRSRYTL